MSDHGSEYGRLLAERDRLIAAGVDPAELEMPLPPVGSAPADSLDAAWAEAEAALPEGWEHLAVRLDRFAQHYVAAAGQYDDSESEHETGATPAAALHALAERLREHRGERR